MTDPTIVKALETINRRIGAERIVREIMGEFGFESLGEPHDLYNFLNKRIDALYPHENVSEDIHSDLQIPIQ